MSPLGATSMWRAWPCPSCTTIAENPAGSVSPSLSAAVAVPVASTQPAAATLTTWVNVLARDDLRMVDSSEFRFASTKVVNPERHFIGEAIVRAIPVQRNGGHGHRRITG